VEPKFGNIGKLESPTSRSKKVLSVVNNSQPHSVRLPHGFNGGTDRLFIEPTKAVSTHCGHNIEAVVAKIKVHTKGAMWRTTLYPSNERYVSKQSGYILVRYILRNTHHLVHLVKTFLKFLGFGFCISGTCFFGAQRSFER
jgi:hypothetical protein